MALNSAMYNAVQRDITVAFRQGVEMATPLYPSLCTVVPSSGADEKYNWLGAIPGVRKWIGERQYKRFRAGDYTLTNEPWESSVELDRHDVDDDRVGGLRAQFNELGAEAAYHPDELLFEVIGGGESSACFDGQFFYDTDHSWGDSGTQSNDLTYNVVTPSAPTAAEFLAAFHQALKAMLDFKNDQGKPFFRPRFQRLDNLVVRVPLTMYEAATQAFSQDIQIDPSGAAGVSRFALARPTVLAVPYMGASYTNGSDVKFDLDYVGGYVRPFVFQARSPLRFQTKGIDSIEDKSIKAMTEARYNVGYGAWWYSVRTTLT